jgi:hypothetical protein
VLFSSCETERFNTCSRKEELYAWTIGRDMNKAKNMRASTGQPHLKDN